MSAAAVKLTAKKVIVCADDFGLTATACDSIVALAELNAISATSCAVEGPFCALRASALLNAAANVSMGLHVNLTQNAADPGYVSLHAWIFRCFVLRHADKKWLATAIARQLDRFEMIFKRAPDFIDGHEHVHQFPVVRDVLAELLQRRYVSPIAMRSTLPRISRGAKAAIIAALGGRAMRRALLKNKFATNLDFAGVYDFSTQVAFAKRMRAWIDSIADGGLIMCHPEVGASAAAARCNEHAFLSSSAWLDLRGEYHVQLVPFNTTSLSACNVSNT